MLGAGLQLSPNAMHVLKALGLEKRIDQAASAPESIEIENAVLGHKLVSLPLGKSIKEKFGAPYNLIHRADLQDILFNACNNHPNIEVRFSSEVIEMAPHGRGVTVMLNEKGETNELQASGLIVADGVWSKLRTEVIGLDAPEYSGKIAWRALVPFERGKTENRTRVWFGPKSHVVSYPVRNGAFQNLVIITGGPESTGKETVSADANELKMLFKGWKGDFLPMLDRKTKWTGWPLYEVKTPNRMAYGTVALIGDAAHAMLPFAAQGAAMAIEDAAVLATQITVCETVEEAFRTYEKLRVPRVSRVAKTARANGRIYHMSGIRADVRDLGMWLMPTRFLSARQNWIYGWRT